MCGLLSYRPTHFSKNAERIEKLQRQQSRPTHFLCPNTQLSHIVQMVFEYSIPTFCMLRTLLSATTQKQFVCECWMEKPQKDNVDDRCFVFCFRKSNQMLTPNGLLNTITHFD